ncbi:MAG: hypothetical protein M1478_01215 [Deltaproteobacteria bacterium]|nr:hypothetical protein [Deltaproteobacteria bacterium]
MKGGLNFVKKVSIKAKLLFLIIFVFILILSFLTYYSVSSQNKMSVKMTSADAVITAKTMLSSLNAMMLNGTISKKSDRRQLFKIFKKIQGIKDVKVIRGEAVDKEFGPGLKQENPTTGFDKEILGSNKEIISIFNKNGHEYLKVGVPFVAKKMSRGINCLMCHTVKDGTTLGGVKLIYSMKNAVSSSDIFMRNIIIVSAIFLVLSILAIYGLLKSIFIKPTKNLYDKLNDIVRGDGDYFPNLVRTLFKPVYEVSQFFRKNRNIFNAGYSPFDYVKALFCTAGSLFCDIAQILRKMRCL